MMISERAIVPNVVWFPVWTRQGGRRHVWFAAVVLLLLGAFAAALATELAGQLGEVPSIAAPVASSPAPVVVPNRALNGKIAFTIPLGAAEAQVAGGTPYVMPPAIRLQVGDEVVITNEDVYPHIILGSLAMPGATTRIVFDEPGVQPYSSGCTANGGTINSFTSVIVSERS
jgi:hypothetical protein